MTKFFKPPTTKLQHPASNRGFTLVELIVAMAFFSFMMVFLSIGIIQIAKLYQAGLSNKRTQSAARFIMEDISREVRAATEIEIAEPNRLCLRGAQITLYERTADNSINKTAGGGECTAVVGTTQQIVNGAGLTQAKQLDFSGVRLIDSSGPIVSVRIALIITTGAGDQFAAGGTDCLPGPGSQFCSTARYTNVVSLRGQEQ